MPSPHLLIVASVGVTAVLFNSFSGTIALFSEAGVAAALLSVPPSWLEWRLPRPLAIALVVLGALALVLGFVTGIGLQVLSQGQGLLLDLRARLQGHDLTPLNDYLDRQRFAVILRRSFLGFIQGQLLLVLFLTVGTALIFPLLGIRYALILAVIVGVLDAIPGIGATHGIVLVRILVLVQIQDNLVHPRVMGRAMHLNPVVLFRALFIAQRVAGLLGVFLSIPIAGMVAT